MPRQLAGHFAVLVAKSPNAKFPTQLYLHCSQEHFYKARGEKKNKK
jgi:hypothetical protein